jgi:hypothetical protein
MAAVQAAVIDRLVDGVVQAVRARLVLDPLALRLLMQYYIGTGRESLREVLAQALSDAVEVRFAEGNSDGDPAWTIAFGEAAALAGDDQIGQALATEVRRLRAGWPARGAVGPAMRAVGACLHALRLSPSDVSPLLAVADAIDELERCAGAAYRPGEGIAQRIDRPDGPLGSLRDHVAAADALLAAYALTARLPYPMLAEEIAAAARQRWWDGSGRFVDDGAVGERDGDAILVNCEAAQVLVRLAALEDDPDYRAQVTPSAGADYPGDAGRVLDWLTAALPLDGRQAAAVGIALGEWNALGKMR